MSWNIKTPGDYINGPLTVAGSATITGDLTVDTSTLKVDSTNDRVGIGLATPTYRLHIQGSAGSQLVLQTNNTDATAKEGTVSARHYTNAEEPVSTVGGFSTSTNNYVYVGGGFNSGNAATSVGFYTAANNTTVTGTERYNIDSTGISTWSVAGTTAMTLNSTGLGIGIAPDSAKATRLSVYQTGDLTDETAPFSVGNTAASGMRLYAGVNNTNEYVYIGSVKSGTGYRSLILQPNGGNVGVGVTPTGTRRLELKSAGTSNTTFAAHFRDSADTLLFHVRSDGYFNTGQGTLSPYSNTTASAANMFVDSSGFVYRSTSSLKYKTDVKDSIHGLADVLKLRSVTYKSKNGDDTVFGGMIAEEVHAAGLTEFVAYAPDKTPDAINYGNMVALLVSAIQELTARVQTLEAR